MIFLYEQRLSKFKLLILALVLLCATLRTNADIVDVTFEIDTKSPEGPNGNPPSENNHISLDFTRFIYASEMIVRKDAPFSRAPGNGHTYIDMKLSLSLKEASKRDTEIYFFLSPARDRVEVNCPNPPKFEDPTMVNRHIVTIEKDKLKPAHDDHVTWTVDRTGQYMVYAAACQLDRPLKIDLQMVWMNPFGHLSGSLMGNMLFSRALVIIYSIFLPIWLIFIGIYRQNLFRIHTFIGIVSFLCLLDAIFAYWDYWHHNVYGRPSSILVAFATMATMLQQAAWPVLCFTIALGYGISRPSLGVWRHRITLILFCYLISGAVQRGGERLGAKLLVAAAGGLSMFLTLVLFIISCASVYDTTLQLRARRQEVKLSLYRRVSGLLLITAVSVISFSLYSFFAQQFSNRYLERHWSVWWLHSGGFMQIVYLFDVLAVAFIFRPSIEYISYQQFSDKEGDFEDVQLDSVEIELGLGEAKDDANPHLTDNGVGNGDGEGDGDEDRFPNRVKTVSEVTNNHLMMGGSEEESKLSDHEPELSSDSYQTSRLNNHDKSVGSTYYSGNPSKAGVLDELVEELGLTPENTRADYPMETDMSDADLTEH